MRVHRLSIWVRRVSRKRGTTYLLNDNQTKSFLRSHNPSRSRTFGTARCERLREVEGNEGWQHDAFAKDSSDKLTVGHLFCIIYQ